MSRFGASEFARFWWLGVLGRNGFRAAGDLPGSWWARDPGDPTNRFQSAGRFAALVIQEMAQAMNRLGQDKTLRRRMGQAARNHIAASFTWERKGELLNRYYTAIATSVSPSPCDLPKQV